MVKGLILLLSLLAPFVYAAPIECDPSEQTVFQHFLASPFGKASRTISDTEAKAVVSLVSEFKSNHPKIEVTRIEVLVCTSHYPLAPISITDKNENEHMELALQRALNLKKEFNTQNVPAQISHRACGPAFVNLDKNWRLVVKGKSGKIYDQVLGEIENTPGLQELYKSEALLNSFDEVKAKYPEPLLAKYKAFQGYRLSVLGKNLCGSSHHKIEAGQKESKRAKQE